MTTRARYADVIVDPTGVPMAGATVDVYDTGTTSHIAGTIHDAAVAGSSLPNPIVANAQGEVEFWLDTPIRVDLKYSRPGYVPETHTVEVLAAAPPASTVVVTPTGGISSADVQSALAELDTEKSATSHGHSGTYELVYPITALTSTAIQAAIDACNAAGGGRVTGPGGVYTLSAGITMKSKVHVDLGGTWSVKGFLAGSSALPPFHAAVWQLADSVNADMVTFPSACIGATLSGVTLSGNKTNQSSGGGVRFVGGGSPQRNGNRLERVCVAQVKGKGILVDLNQPEVRLHDVLVMESGDDNIDIEAEDVHCSFVLSGYAAGNGIVFGAGSYSCQLHDADVFNNTLAGVVVKTPVGLRNSSVQCNNNGREGLVVSDAEFTSYNDWYLASNGQEFLTSAIRYAEVRMHHTTTGNDGVVFVGCLFNGGNISSYGIDSDEPAPKAASLIGCEFTGTFISGFTRLSVYNVYGGTKVQDKIRPRSAGSIGLVVEGLGGQTADLLDVRTDSATHILRVGPGAGTPGAGTFGVFGSEAAQAVSGDQLRAALQAYGILPAGGVNLLNLVDADVAAGAAIAKSKLAALGIVNADVAVGAAIVKSKLAALGIVDADVSSISQWLIADPDALTTGESTIPRSQALSNNIAMATQVLNIAYFTARKTEQITQIRTIQGAVAAGATPTLIRWGVWPTDATGALLTGLLASTPNDTTLLAGSSGAQVTKTFSSTGFAKVAGTRYAVGLLVVTAATAPQIVAEGGGSMSTEKGVSPRLSATVTGQADLPSTVVAGSLVGTSSRPYFVLLP